MTDTDNMIIRQDDDLISAWSKIESNKYGIVFVVDEHLKLLGSLSDGDIRRSILKNKDLNINCSMAMNKGVHFLKMGELNDRTSDLKVLPVVDNSMHIVSFSFLNSKYSISTGSPLVIYNGK